MKIDSHQIYPINYRASYAFLDCLNINRQCHILPTETKAAFARMDAKHQVSNFYKLLYLGSKENYPVVVYFTIPEMKVHSSTHKPTVLT